MPWSQEKYSKKTLEILQSGILILDSEERIVFCNPWVIKHLDSNFKDITGKVFLEVFPELKASRI